jgi:two-component system, OmpR family, response regulator
MASSEMRRVLVVEDEPDIQKIAKIALAEVGLLSVEVCSSGTEALAVAPSFAPDLIILDVMMPGMDGPATLHALRRVPALASTPVVFLTARVQPHEIALYKRMGAAYIIPKPFDPMTLASTLQKIWQVRRP